MDYYKSMVPSQMIVERGSDLVIINPGSANLRIGLASSQAPFVVPHVIAWQRTKQQTDAGKGAAGEEKFSRHTLTTARKNEREDVLQLIERQLRVPPVSKEEGRSWQRKADTFENARLESETEFTWTNVEVEKTPKATSSGTRDDSEANGSSEYDAPTADGTQETKDLRKFICGDEALRIPTTKGYYLRRPICRGRLNASEQYSLQQVCDDLFVIWDWALRTKLNLNTEDRKRFSVVLVIPDTLDSREIKELLTIVLKDLHFSSAVIHQESVAVTFGNGVSSGCVVNIGAQVTIVICVEDGVALPLTRVTLPFGGEDISRCLLWLQQRLKTWPPIEVDPIVNPLDLLLLNRVRETHCCIEEGDHRAIVDLQFHAFGSQSQHYRVTMSELNVPPMGLFYPALLTPEEYVPLTRPWYHTDSEEIILDDAIHMDIGKRPDAMEPGFVVGHQQVSTVYPVYVESSVYSGNGTVRNRNEDRLLGLPQAIVNSILSVGRMDLQRKLFSSIQLAGGTASTPGLIDAVEDRVLQAIPMHESIDTVEVLPPRIETGMVAWKGGAILGILDFTRDTWVQREDWVEGGIRVGGGRKYKDSFFQQTHTFWYTSS